MLTAVHLAPTPIINNKDFLSKLHTVPFLSSNVFQIRINLSLRLSTVKGRLIKVIKLN